MLARDYQENQIALLSFIYVRMEGFYVDFSTENETFYFSRELEYLCILTSDYIANSLKKINNVYPFNAKLEIYE